MKRNPPAARMLIRICQAVLLAGVTFSTPGCKPAKEGEASVKSNAYPGYTLVQQLASNATKLIDSEGRTVHRWLSENRLGGGTYLLENGNLLRSAIPAKSAQQSPTPGLSGMVEMFDWEGNRLWSFTLSNDKQCLHHDIRMLPNGNILLLVVEELTTEEQVAIGRDPSRATAGLKLDYIIELKPEGKEGGQIVWEWHMKDHLIQDFDKTKKNYGVVADHPDKLDINFIENIRKMTGSGLRVLQSLGYVSSTAKITPQRSMADWTHSNSVTYHPGLDQILISVRSLGEIWIIDHGTTTAEAASDVGGKMNKGGGILFRWGNPQAYQSGAPADQQFFGQHDAQWIQPGMPGEGNILVFNNGEGRKEGEYSAIDEIKPPLKADGSYEHMKGEAYGPAKPEWRYVAEKKEDFLSTFLSGVQRLPNGNTLICSGVQGRMFEVTKEGSIAWEHKMDVTTLNKPGGRGQPKGPMAGPGGRRPPQGGARPGMMRGPGKAPGLAQNGPAGTPDGVPGGKLPTLTAGGTTFTAAEMAVLNGTPLEPPPGFGGAPKGGAGRGALPGGPGGPGGPPGGGGALFRATRYGLDFPAFKGRALDPLPPPAIPGPR